MERCANCMKLKDKEKQGPCPYCGFDEQKNENKEK